MLAQSDPERLQKQFNRRSGAGSSWASRLGSGMGCTLNGALQSVPHRVSHRIQGGIWTLIPAYSRKRPVDEVTPNYPTTVPCPTVPSNPPAALLECLGTLVELP
jgi:hypothetical protein